MDITTVPSAIFCILNYQYSIFGAAILHIYTFFSQMLKYLDKKMKWFSVNVSKHSMDAVQKHISSSELEGSCFLQLYNKDLPLLSWK